MDMYCFPPEVVLLELRTALKSSGITQAGLAKIMGYKTYQSVSNMFRSNHYLKPKQAKILSEEFGYQYDYLTKGSGSLTKKGSVPEVYSPLIELKGEIGEQKSRFDNEVYRELLLRLNDDTANSIVSLLDALEVDLADAQSEDDGQSADYRPFFNVARKRIRPLMEKISEEAAMRRRPK